MLKPSLSRDCHCRTHVNQRLFPFSCSITERFMPSLTHGHISENQYVKITSGYRFGRESWVIVTFSLSQRIESHMATKVPSPIISMIKRTALCPPMDSLRKQSTRVSLGNKQIPGLCTWRLGSFLFKRSSPEVFYLGDLLERLLQGCARHRSFDNSSQVAAASLVS